MARRVRVRDFYPESIELEMPDGQVFEIDALTVDEMGRLFNAERLLGETKDATALEGLAEANTVLVELLRARFPDRDVPDYRMPPNAIGGLFGTLAGAETVADAVHDAIVDPDAETSPEGGGVAEDGSPLGEVGAGDPLPSTKPSPTPSFDSERTSTGDRNGGDDQAAPGQPSGPTSSTPVERVAS